MVFTVSSKAQSSWLLEVTAILKAQSNKAWYYCDFEGSVEQSMVFTASSQGKHGIYKLSRAGTLKGCDFECSVKQSMVFTVFSMVFTTSVELAFRRDWILKAQSSKTEYLLCLAWC